VGYSNSFLSNRHIPPPNQMFIKASEMAGFSTDYVADYGIPTGKPLAQLLSVTKYDNSLRFSPNPEAWNEAMQAHENLLRPWMTGLNPKTPDETYSGMNPLSSAGYPYSDLPKSHPFYHVKKGEIVHDKDRADALIKPLLDRLYPVFDVNLNAETNNFLSTTSHKHEVLPSKKLKPEFIDGIYYPERSRTITFPGTLMAGAQECFMGPIEAQYGYASAADPRVGSMIYLSPWRGGTFRHIIDLKPPDWVITTNDRTSYDSTQHEDFMRSEMTPIEALVAETNPEYARALHWVNEQTIETNLALPNGQALKTKGMQNSGDRNTSGGNCRRTWQSNCYCFFVTYPDATASDFFKLVIQKIMGDDVISFRHPSLKSFSNRQIAAICWRDLGLIVKVNEKDSTTWEGHTFIGFHFLPNERGDIVAKFKTETILAHAAYPLKKEGPMEFYDRLAGLACLAYNPTYEPQQDALYHLLRKVAYECLQGGVADNPFPSLKQVEHLWTGNESSCHLPSYVKSCANTASRMVFGDVFKSL
jgi:hypothetical protein